VGAVTDVSVVVPVYNECGVIARLIDDLEREVVGRLPVVEVIVVDDCSTDGSGAILEELSRERPWLSVDRAPTNAGHGPSVLRGLHRATGEWVFQVDSDGQFVIEEFEALWSRRAEGDLLLGVRVARSDDTHRLILSRVISRVVSALAGRPLRDSNTPFRLMRRELVLDLLPLIPRAARAPSIMVTLGAARRGWHVVEVPVTHLPRAHGTSTLRSLRLVSFSLRGLRELLSFDQRLRREPAARRTVVHEVA